MIVDGGTACCWDCVARTPHDWRLYGHCGPKLVEVMWLRCCRWCDKVWSLFPGGDAFSEDPRRDPAIISDQWMRITRAT